MGLESSARLAGFALAHAAWSISDLPRGNLLTPFVITEEAGGRELTRFEAATQAAAIEAGHRQVREHAERVEGWAFARDGTIRMGDPPAPYDVLVVEFGSRDDDPRYAVVQPYEAYAVRQQFRLLGDPLLTRGGVVLGADEFAALRTAVREGIGQHSAVAGLWAQWRQG